MRRLILLGSFLLVMSNGYSQVAFQCRYDWPAVDNIAETIMSVFPAQDDSGYFCLHSQFTSQDTGIAILRIGNDGSITWSNIYKATHNTPYSYMAEKMLRLSDSSIMVLGYLDGAGLSLKIDYSGNLINARKFTPPAAIIMERELNGFLYGVGGYSYGGINGGLFCKRDLNGDFLWSVQMSGGTTRRVILTCFTPTSDNGFLLAGWRQIYNTGGPSVPTTPVIIKTDSVGVIQWQTQLNFAGTGMVPNQVEEMPDHGFLFSMSPGWNGRGSFVRTDSTCQVQWNYHYEHNSQDVQFTDFQNIPGSQSMACGVYYYNILPFTIDSVGNPVMIKKIIHADSAQVEYFHYNDHGWIGFGHKSTFLDRALFIAKTDTAFHGACGELNTVFTSFSYTITDSIASIVAVPVTINTYNADTSILVFNYPMNQTDYCPPLNLATGDEVNPFPFKWGPVPARDAVTFTTVDSNEKQLKLFDLTGSLVAQVSFSGNSYSLNRSVLKPGIYFFELVSGNDTRRGKILFE